MNSRIIGLNTGTGLLQKMERRVSMTVLVTSVNGQSGHDVVLELKSRGYDTIGSGSSERGRESQSAYQRRLRI